MTKGASLTPTMVPWGRLSDGKIGLSIRDTDGVQKNAVLEVWDNLANASSQPNFPGRLILDTTTGLVYVYDPVAADYRELGSLPATVGAVGGNPPTVPTPLTGELFWDLDTKVAFVWDGTRWEPIGGRYAGMFVSAYHPSVSGVQGSFSLGLTVAQIDSIQGAPQNVEAYIDGVRQSAAGGQYFITGGTITFPIPPAAGTNLFLRTLVSDIIAPTAEVITKFIEANGIQKEFDTGVTGVSRTGTFVYVNGVMQTGPESGSGVFAIDPDYEIVSQDTTITQVQVTNVVLDEVTVSTLDPHNASIGEQVILENIPTEPLYEGTFSVVATPTANTFTVTNTNASVMAPGPITDPGMYFTPPFVDDKIQLPFNLADPALPSGAKVLIKAVRNLSTVEASGEVNEGLNIGAGVPVYKNNSGTDLVFRSILAGANVAIADTGNEVLISATSANTFEDRNGINTNYHLLGATESYIGVLSTMNPVTIDLSSVVDTIDAGRRIVIKDESGGAAINNISIIHSGKTFDGQPNYVITNNFGVITLVFSGANWFTTTGGTTGGGGGSGVTSFAGRIGAVIPAASDYNAIKIDYSNVSSGLASTDVQNAIDEVAAAGAASVPSGVMAPFGGNVPSIPSGWLSCDGSSIGNGVSGATYTGPQYETLFNIVKTMTGGTNTGAEDFASGDTVVIPDMRGRVPVGPDTTLARITAPTPWVPDATTPGATGGEDRHVLTESELAGHTHTAQWEAGTTGPGYPGFDGTGDDSGPAATSSTGSDFPHNNMQPFQLVNWIIKV